MFYIKNQKLNIAKYFDLSTNNQKNKVRENCS